MAQPLLLPEAPSQIHSGLFSPFGQPPISEGCRVGLNFSIINEQSYSEGNWGKIGIDAESWVLDLTARAATPVGELGVSWPLKYVWGGVLDAPLDVFHSAVELNRIVNPERGRSLAFYELASGEKAFYDQPALGLGDPVLSWAYPVSDFWVKGTLGLPLGTPEQFISARAWRSSVQVGYQQEGWGLAGQVGWVLGKSVLAPLKEQTQYGIKGWWQVPLELPVRLESEWRTRPLAVGGTFAGSTWTLRMVFAGVGFQEDLTPALPDVSLSTAQEWSCF